MLKRMLRYSLLLLLLAMPPRGGRAQSPPETLAPGPDVILGDLPSLIQAGSNGTQVGLMMATDICNNGDVQVNWFRLPETDHPVIPQNLYRMSGGANNDERFEQIGQSWVKHAFFPLQQNACGFGCTPSPDGAHLGVGCSNPDSASLNASQPGLGSRAWVNPFTGIFLSTSGSHTGHTHDGTTHRILVEGNDLNTTMNQGATYYGEAQLVTPHEYAWCQAHSGQCNMFNNVSYRQFMVVGTTSFNFSAVGATVRMSPAINAWPGATIQAIEPEPGVDGRAFIAYKVTVQPGLPVIWHYEYAIYNQNLDRGIQSFSVPGGCGMGTPFNLEFHAPLNHPGFADDGTVGDAGYSNAPWTAQAGAAASWSTETFAQNPNANALRWGTLYNFRFDAGTPPTTANATIGFFKTGAPIIVAIPGPSTECVPTPTPTPPPPATPTPSPFFLPDLAVTKTDSPDPVQVGANLTYTITVSNLDPTLSMFAEMADNLPAGVNLVSVTPSQGSCTVTSTINCQLGIIAGGASATVSVVVTPTTAGTLSNTASVPPFEDPNTGNNTDTELTTVIPTLTPTPTPTPAPAAQAVNLSTRMFVQTGDDVGIGGFIITGTGPKNVLLRAIGPSLIDAVQHPLADPVLELHGPGGFVTITNNNWRDDQEQEIIATGIPPTDNLESAIVASLSPGGYTAIVRGNGNAVGVALIELYDLDLGAASKLANISTRAFVQVGNESLIAGFILGNGAGGDNLVVRGLGPSLSALGVPTVLDNPALELRNSNGTLLIENDDWQDDPVQAAIITTAGLAPSNEFESAIAATLPPGAYTVLLAGASGSMGFGNGLVEVYDLGAP